MNRNYDTIAAVYDRLAGLVYGKALMQAQAHLVRAIPPQSAVLVAGGGTGWILAEIANTHPAGLIIDYVDSSAKMIALARQRNVGANTINFINAPIEAIAHSSRYDVIITPFLLDNFTDATLPAVFLALHERLGPGGLWLYADFQDTGRLWQRTLLAAMYFFFRLLCGIPARCLPDAAGCFSRYGYEAADSKTLFKEFIIATVYRKVN